jgi:hypothetical protein
VSLGFTALDRPFTRRVMAHRVTIAQAAALGGLPADDLLSTLNAEMEARRAPPPQDEGACGRHR